MSKGGVMAKWLGSERMAPETQFSVRNKKFAAVDGGRGDRPWHSNLCEFATYQNDQTGVGKLRTRLPSILNAEGAR